MGKKLRFFGKRNKLTAGADRLQRRVKYIERNFKRIQSRRSRGKRKTIGVIR